MVGKRVLQRTYAHVLLLGDLADEDRRCVEEAVRISGLTAGEHFHVLRLDPEHQEIALLSYPMFFDELFPGLLGSWRVHLPTRTVRFRDYSSSLNPPILHRKELMLPASHPEQARLQQITGLAESLGLFDDPVRIGFRSQWNELLASKGYAVVGHELVPVANVSNDGPDDLAASLPAGAPVSRHLTALSRSFLSAPVQALLRHDLLKESRTFFDYGCGKGDDIEGIRTLGISASGWDPYFGADEILQTADVVNIGFVINVIEDMGERIEALQRAYELTKGVLSVSAMLWSSGAAKGRPYGDGHLTSRNTFQKYFSQGELQHFIESVLDEQAIPVGPGVFLVFRDRYLEQQFLTSRQSDPSRAPRLLAARAVLHRPPRAARPARVKPEEDPARRAEADAVWQQALQLGRLPEEEEYEGTAQAVAVFGSWSRALRAVSGMADQDLLQKAASARADEIRAFFAMQAFGRRKPLRDLEPRLRRDIKTFFSSLGVAELEGRRLLQQCADVAAIRAACERAASMGLGWLDTDHSLQLHTSLIPRLDPVLRVYVGCATALYGDVLTADLVKIHIQSGKITLMKFDDFVGSPLPRMLERVKVKLREQDLDFFEYGDRYEPPFLYFKSRYINEEFRGYPEQQEFDRQLEDLGLPLANGYGPEPAEFQKWLARQRREITGLRLAPSTHIPPLDDACGKNFTFRHLIECGETWERTRVDNTPKSADTYNALFELAKNVLDPVIDYFGGIKLTYGFASRALTRDIKGRIEPKLDQHASCEVNTRGAPICPRLGAAVDFLVEYEDMHDVASWIADNCAYDRIYLYEKDRPIHVSVGPQQSREVYEMVTIGTRRVPRRSTHRIINRNSV
jgi:DNA phosphorothioation-associated putative methyltransferase